MVAWVGKKGRLNVFQTAFIRLAVQWLGGGSMPINT